MLKLARVSTRFDFFLSKCEVKEVSIIIQQDATIYSLFTSANRSTCFRWYLHPSSGAHITVSTVSGFIETVTATCRERDWMGTESYVYWTVQHLTS